MCRCENCLNCWQAVLRQQRGLIAAGASLHTSSCLAHAHTHTMCSPRLLNLNGIQTYTYLHTKVTWSYEIYLELQVDFYSKRNKIMGKRFLCRVIWGFHEFSLSSGLKMETVCVSETLATSDESTRCQNPEEQQCHSFPCILKPTVWQILLSNYIHFSSYIQFLLYTV